MNPGPADGEKVGRAQWRALRNGLLLYGAVIAGGIIGSLARWLVALAITVEPGGLPWPTFIANVSGCFVIGFYAALTAPGGRMFASARTRQFVMTGFCGGYTTFSGFALETVRLVAGGDVNSAVLYLAVSLVSWLSAVWIGEAVGDWINR